MAYGALIVVGQYLGLNNMGLRDKIHAVGQEKKLKQPDKKGKKVLPKTKKKRKRKKKSEIKKIRERKCNFCNC